MTGLAGIWAMMHVQLARVTEIPELAMSEADAKTWFTAAQNVLRHYSIAASQKAIDLMTFASVTAIVYTPRAAAVVRRMRRGEDWANARPEQFHTATVFNFTPAPGSPNGQAHAGHTAPAPVEPEILDVETNGPAH